MNLESNSFLTASAVSECNAESLCHRSSASGLDALTTIDKPCAQPSLFESLGPLPPPLHTPFRCRPRKESQHQEVQRQRPRHLFMSVDFTTGLGPSFSSHAPSSPPAAPEEAAESPLDSSRAAGDMGVVPASVDSAAKSSFFSTPSSSSTLTAWSSSSALRHRNARWATRHGRDRAPGSTTQLKHARTVFQQAGNVAEQRPTFRKLCGTCEQNTSLLMRQEA